MSLSSKCKVCESNGLISYQWVETNFNHWSIQNCNHCTLSQEVRDGMLKNAMANKKWSDKILIIFWLKRIVKKLMNKYDN